MATFTNQATLSYNNTTTNSNVVVGELLDVLVATKTAVMDDYVAHDDVTYVISIVNTGATPFTGLEIEDNLGAYPYSGTTLYPLTYVSGSIRYYINGAIQAAPSVTAGPPLQITGINVPANGNAMLIYEVEANAYAPLDVDDNIENVAMISGGGLTEPLEVKETIYTENLPLLTISKNLTPSSVVENGQLTYTFVILNMGNTAATAGDNVTVTDTFDPILTGLTVTFNGAPWNDPANYSYDSGTGIFTTVPGEITVDAATYIRDSVTHEWVVNPGVSFLTVTGTI
ncbi:MAG: hypothetical protein EOM66_02970 [Clostridia bacterium]|nr:hypothetical protein [Candidatus Pelethousia sp.]NCB30351.1 hypothetical protein [Clostridia bacterium]